VNILSKLNTENNQWEINLNSRCAFYFVLLWLLWKNAHSGTIDDMLIC